MSRSSLSTEPINQYERADSKDRANDDRHPPKVVHLSTYDIAGGAARAAYRLHSGLRKAGVDSSMFVREAMTSDRSVITFEQTTTFCGRAKRRNRVSRSSESFVPLFPPDSDRLEPF